MELNRDMQYDVAKAVGELMKKSGIRPLREEGKIYPPDSCKPELSTVYAYAKEGNTVWLSVNFIFSWYRGYVSGIARMHAGAHVQVSIDPEARHFRILQKHQGGMHPVPGKRTGCTKCPQPEKGLEEWLDNRGSIYYEF